LQADLNSPFSKITFLYNLDYSGSTLELVIQFILGNIFRLLTISYSFISHLLNLYPSKFILNFLLNKFSAIARFKIDNNLNNVI
jgi:hypothetical protein